MADEHESTTLETVRSKVKGWWEAASSAAHGLGQVVEEIPGASPGRTARAHERPWRERLLDPDFWASQGSMSTFGIGVGLRLAQDEEFRTGFLRGPFGSCVTRSCEAGSLLSSATPYGMVRDTAHAALDLVPAAKLAWSGEVLSGGVRFGLDLLVLLPVAGAAGKVLRGASARTRAGETVVDAAAAERNRALRNVFPCEAADASRSAKILDDLGEAGVSMDPRLARTAHGRQLLRRRWMNVVSYRDAVEKAEQFALRQGWDARAANDGFDLLRHGETPRIGAMPRDGVGRAGGWMEVWIHGGRNDITSFWQEVRGSATPAGHARYEAKGLDFVMQQIAASERYTGKGPILLVSCYSGRGIPRAGMRHGETLAQQLADATGRPVVAPTGVAWTHTARIEHEAATSSRWRTFLPAEATTRTSPVVHERPPVTRSTSGEARSTSATPLPSLVARPSVAEAKSLPSYVGWAPADIEADLASRGYVMATDGTHIWRRSCPDGRTVIVRIDAPHPNAKPGQAGARAHYHVETVPTHIVDANGNYPIQRPFDGGPVIRHEASGDGVLGVDEPDFFGRTHPPTAP